MIMYQFAAFNSLAYSIWLVCLSEDIKTQLTTYRRAAIGL